MEKSENYHRRKELLSKLEVPTMTEVKRELGNSLAKVVFGECPEALKEDIGLEPRLKGAGANLWISPSDLLIGKVCLKPPLTDKHIKALTHEGIIEIGNAIEQKFWNEMRKEKEEALEKQEEYLKTIAERERRVAVKMARDEEQLACGKHIEEINCEFEIRLQDELEKLTQKMLEEQQLMIEAQIAADDEKWQLKLENAVQETTNNLTAQFLDDLEKQKKDLEESFRTEFERQRTEFEYATKQEEEFCKTTMKQLRHCLECKNLANLMYVLCMERRKCGIERSLLEYAHKNKVDDLNKTIQAKEQKLKELTEDRDHRQRQLDIREKCVVEILKQFQKFINYALRATPTQAEFLLNVRKMMLFEIAQAMVRINKEKAPHLARKILPWISDSETSSVSDEKSGVKLTDYHDCLNEIISPDAESDFVPAFYYNDKLYVNEDLRLMVAKGVELSDTNMLWNKDVENMIKILKSSVGRDVVEEEPKTDSTDSISEEEIQSQYIETVQSEDVKSEKSRKSCTSSFGTATKKSSMKYSEEKITNPLVYCSISGGKDPDHADSKATTDFIKKLLKANLDADIEPIDTVGLLAAKDSLVKMRESKMSSLKELPILTTEEIETGKTLKAVRESLNDAYEIKSNLTEGSVNFENLDAIRIPDQLEIKKPNKSSKASIIKSPRVPSLPPPESILVSSSSPRRNMSKESKLVSAVDSIIIHRNSIAPTPNRKSLSHPYVESPPGRSASRKASVVSRLSETRDSLELIRKQSNLSRSRANSTAENLVLSSSHLEISANGESISPNRKLSPLTTSYAELAKIPTVVADTSVYFSPITEVYESNVLQTSDSPWKIYEAQEAQPSRDNFLTKPNELKLTGAQDSKEHLQGSISFTVNRINSIMDVLRDEPSLIRLFTSCTK